LFKVVDSHPDIVDICLPTHLHYDAAMDALERGKDVILEKPPTETVQQFDALAARGRVFPVYQYNWAGLENVLFRKHYHVNITAPRSAEYYRSWRSSHGGALAMHGSHAIDLLYNHLDRNNVSVRALLSTSFHDIDVEDHALVSLDDGKVTATINVATPERCKNTFYFAGNLITNSADLFVSQFVNIYDYIERGMPLTVTPERARWSVAVLEACYLSAAQEGSRHPVQP
jgi:predicted dehydrogenase